MRIVVLTLMMSFLSHCDFGAENSESGTSFLPVSPLMEACEV